MDKLSVNDPCPCGSGLKYKKCHGHAVAEKRPSTSLLVDVVGQDEPCGMERGTLGASLVASHIRHPHAVTPFLLGVIQGCISTSD